MTEAKSLYGDSRHESCENWYHFNKPFLANRERHSRPLFSFSLVRPVYVERRILSLYKSQTFVEYREIYC